MEHAVRLLKMVLRMFYPNEHIVVMDYLLRHSELSEDRLAEMLLMTSKQVNKTATLLRDDGLLVCEIRQEVRDYDGKPINRVYWRTNLDAAVKNIRARLQRMTSDLDSQRRAGMHGETEGYKCIQCKTVYELIDYNRILDPSTGTPRCEVCHRELGDEDSLGGDQEKLDDLYRRFNEETKPLQSLLKTIDRESRERDQKASKPVSPTEVLSIPDKTTSKPVGKSQEMPVWHSHSTVSGQKVKGPSSAQTADDNVTAKGAADRKRQASDAHVEQYYSSLVGNDEEAMPKRPKADQPVEAQVDSEGQVMVMAGGKPVPLVAVTEADRAAMTAEENAAYMDAYSSLFGDI